MKHLNMYLSYANALAWGLPVPEAVTQPVSRMTEDEFRAGLYSTIWPRSLTPYRYAPLHGSAKCSTTSDRSYQSWGQQQLRHLQQGAPLVGTRHLPAFTICIKTKNATRNTAPHFGVAWTAKPATLLLERQSITMPAVGR